MAEPINLSHLDETGLRTALRAIERRLREVEKPRLPGLTVDDDVVDVTELKSNATLTDVVGFVAAMARALNFAERK